MSAPVDELNARFDPTFTSAFPVFVVANKGWQVVSLDSSETTTLGALTFDIADPLPLKF